ncbi:ribosome biogenesis protein Nop16 [Rhodofomes roseus]|uniref:Nucleolar protein 16 n=1 Tax=Rhodofomes roseus TaxID=34475 RepID=A0ABQ8KVJ3_9APHY|nr:ribosome biogenesis protein Nop16 [Rhodofomes roseus]KAH9842831.1 ribosome biogenesis protein Nop16 [Rhodofomes roseus]
MANPRQRRKSRSGSYKPVHHSRRAKKNLNKQPPIRAPKVLQDAWDRHKTVRQNYEALGLVASLNPTASGGVERPASHAGNPHTADASVTPEASTSQQVVNAHTSVPKGYGRIVRDENGNVIDIILPKEEEHGLADEIMEDLPDASRDEQLAPWVELGSDTKSGPSKAPETHVVRALEEMSQERGARPPRYASTGENAILRRLVHKYGEDVEDMAKDRKLNPDQRTAGELGRAIRKAGGFARLREV